MKHRAVKEYGEQLQWIGVLGEWGMHAIAVDWSVGGMGYACNCSGIEEAVAVEYRTQLQWNMAWSCSGMEEAVAVEYIKKLQRNKA